MLHSIGNLWICSWQTADGSCGLLRGWSQFQDGSYHSQFFVFLVTSMMYGTHKETSEVTGSALVIRIYLIFNAMATVDAK